MTPVVKTSTRGSICLLFNDLLKTGCKVMKFLATHLDGNDCISIEILEFARDMSERVCTNCVNFRTLSTYFYYVIDVPD